MNAAATLGGSKKRRRHEETSSRDDADGVALILGRSQNEQDARWRTGDGSQSSASSRVEPVRQGSAQVKVGHEPNRERRRPEGTTSAPTVVSSCSKRPLPPLPSNLKPPARPPSTIPSSSGRSSREPTQVCSSQVRRHGAALRTDRIASSAALPVAVSLVGLRSNFCHLYLGRNVSASPKSSQVDRAFSSRDPDHVRLGRCQ